MTPGGRRASPRRKPRHAGRAAALQMLYQWDVGRTDMAEVAETYWAVEQDEEPLPPATRRFAEDLASGTVAALDAIDPLIAANAANWRIPRMGAIERAILRLAVFEFLHAPETPQKAVIDEAVELARDYGADDSPRFVNGVLDAVMRRLQGRE